MEVNRCDPFARVRVRFGMVKTLAAYVVGISVVGLLAGCGGNGGGGGGAGQIQAIAGLPSGATTAMIMGATQYQQVGFVEEAGIRYGAIFYGNPSAPLVLKPAQYSDFTLLGTDNQHQVGNGVPVSSPNGMGHALLFSGTADSAVDLHPATFFRTVAWAVSGSQQVGYGSLTDGGPDHPLLWTGTAASVLDLLPAGAEKGHAFAVRNGVQAGSVAAPGAKSHAAIWHGASSSFQDVNPAGFQSSGIAAISDKDYVGSGLPVGALPVGSVSPSHALRWVGTQVIDLHPAGMLASFASATDGKTQVGAYTKDSNTLFRACLWRGSSSSFVDLHALLPPYYYQSQATGVQGKTVYGWALKPDTWVAVTWKLP